MSELEYEDLTPDEGRPVSRSRNGRDGDANDGVARPGQRGRNKRDAGEKPLVTVRWTQQLTERLWALIRQNQELKRVLVNEPSRYLGPSGANALIFSKKDLQKRIAELLFKEEEVDTTDVTIMDNLTRAVKNKLHKTQMLYEQSLRNLPEEFKELNTEAEIPRRMIQQWEKVRDRFPTFFMYHELAREIPLLAKEMEAESQTLGSWKARQLSGSDDGGSPSRLITRPQSWSDDAPLDKERYPEFEVRPPPLDIRQSYSDTESTSYVDASGMRTLSPEPSPSPSTASMNSPLTGDGNTSSVSNWTAVTTRANPLARASLPVGASTVAKRSVPGSPNVPPRTMSEGVTKTPGQDQRHPLGMAQYKSPAPATIPLPGDIKIGPQPYNPNSILQPPAPWTTRPSTVSAGTPEDMSRYPHFGAVQQQGGVSSRFPAIPLHNIPQEGIHLAAQSPSQAEESRRGRATIPLRKHRKGQNSIGSVNTPDGIFTATSPNMSPPAWSTASDDSPPLPASADSPDDNTMERLMEIVKAKESRKRQRDEELIIQKRKKYEDRERQREENQRQREENERQRLHEERQREHEKDMIMRKIELAKLQQASGSMDPFQSQSIPGSATTMSSSSTLTSPMVNLGGQPLPISLELDLNLGATNQLHVNGGNGQQNLGMSQDGSQDMQQYMGIPNVDSMMTNDFDITQYNSPVNGFDHSGLLGLNHSGLHQHQHQMHQLQQQQQQQQQQSMMPAPHQSPHGYLMDIPMLPQHSQHELYGQTDPYSYLLQSNQQSQGNNQGVS